MVVFDILHFPGQRNIGNLLPNNPRQRRACYTLCHILYPVSAAHMSIFWMDSNSTSYLPQDTIRKADLVFVNSFDHILRNYELKAKSLPLPFAPAAFQPTV